MQGLVQQLPAAPELLRCGLAWLARSFPAHAASSYPSLLRIPPQNKADVRALLVLSEASTVSMPVVPAAAAELCLDELLTSPLEAARLQGVKQLGAARAHARLTQLLADDPSAKVRLVVTNLLEICKPPAGPADS